MKNKFFYKNKLTNIYERSSIRSPMSSQILYGERFKILSKSKGWLKIKTSFDKILGQISSLVFFVDLVEEWSQAYFFDESLGHESIAYSLSLHSLGSSAEYMTAYYEGCANCPTL